MLASRERLPFERLTLHLSARQRETTTGSINLILCVVVRRDKAAGRERIGKRRTVRNLNTVLQRRIDD